jgi:hypothetical protein
MPAGNALAAWQDGRIDVTFVTGVNPAPEPWAGIPNGGTIIPNDPGGVTRALAVPEVVPDLHRQWLFELYKAAAQDKDYIAARDAGFPGLVHIILDRDACREIAETGLRTGEPVLEEQGSLVKRVDEILH